MSEDEANINRALLQILKHHIPPSGEDVQLAPLLDSLRGLLLSQGFSPKQTEQAIAQAFAQTEHPTPETRANATALGHRFTLERAPAALNNDPASEPPSVGMTHRHENRLIESAEVLDRVGPVGSTTPQTSGRFAR